jgi:hypothetical protein
VEQRRVELLAALRTRFNRFHYYHTRSDLLTYIQQSSRPKDHPHSIGFYSHPVPWSRVNVKPKFWRDVFAAIQTLRNGF